MIKNNKRGFNLIELAIVLAVVGLVIGGIYVAASSVTDNQRKQKAQSQLLTIVQNMRVAYSNQAFAAAPTVAEAQNARIVPADIINTGGVMYGAYGVIAIGFVDANNFNVTMNTVSRGACIDMLSKSFGTAQAVNQIGLASITVAGAAVALPATVTTANAACAADANTIVFQFTLHI